jgi:hypothetical protein
MRICFMLLFMVIGMAALPGCEGRVDDRGADIEIGD